MFYSIQHLIVRRIVVRHDGCLFFSLFGVFCPYDVILAIYIRTYDSLSKNALTPLSDLILRLEVLVFIFLYVTRTILK